MRSYKEKADRKKLEIERLLLKRSSLSEEIKVLSDIRNFHYRFARKRASKSGAGRGIDVAEYLPEDRLKEYSDAVVERAQLRAEKANVSYQIELKKSRLKAYQAKIEEGFL